MYIVYEDGQIFIFRSLDLFIKGTTGQRTKHVSNKMFCADFIFNVHNNVVTGIHKDRSGIFNENIQITVELMMKIVEVYYEHCLDIDK